MNKDYIELYLGLIAFIIISIFILIPSKVYEDPNDPKQPLESNTEPLRVYIEPTTTARITCYGATGNKMANGKYPEYGYVATSDRNIELGTEIIIDGETFIVGDRTALWVNEKWEVPTIDIYMDDCSRDFGAEQKEIIINK